MSDPHDDSGLGREPYDARVVANFILRYHQERGEEITQLRLYKLLYFSHGWYLAEYNRPLVWNNFEAWQRGPVIKVVRDVFSAFKERPLQGFCSAFDFGEGREVQLPVELAAQDEAFVGGVIEAYRKYSAQELSLITHVKGSSWDNLWKVPDAIGRFGLRLKNIDILKDFQDAVDKPVVGH